MDHVVTMYASPSCDTTEVVTDGAEILTTFPNMQSSARRTAGRGRTRLLPLIWCVRNLNASVWYYGRTASAHGCDTHRAGTFSCRRDGSWSIPETLLVRASSPLNSSNSTTTAP